MDDVIGDTQATFGMIGTIRAMLDDAVRELSRGDPRRPLETHSSRALMLQSEAAGASTTTMQTMAPWQAARVPAATMITSARAVLRHLE